MVNVELLDVADLAQTCDLGVDALKAVGGVELAQPRSEEHTSELQSPC